METKGLFSKPVTSNEHVKDLFPANEDMSGASS